MSYCYYYLPVCDYGKILVLFRRSRMATITLKKWCICLFLLTFFTAFLNDSIPWRNNLGLRGISLLRSMHHQIQRVKISIRRMYAITDISRLVVLIYWFISFDLECNRREGENRKLWKKHPYGKMASIIIEIPQQVERMSFIFWHLSLI